jgi:hypothetical protein
MSASPSRLPHILTRPPREVRAEDLARLRSPELTKAATFWIGKEAGKMPRDERAASLLRVMKSGTTAVWVVAALSALERDTLAAYLRYGGTVNGAVIRVDLMARGVLEVVSTGDPRFRWTRWKHKPIEKLAERLVLLSAREGRSSWFSGYASDTDRAFSTYSVNAALVPHLTPAGPAPWSIPALKESPRPEPPRLPAEVALDLGRVYAWVAERTQVRLNKSGMLATPTARSLAKAVSLSEDDHYPLPDAQALYFELLRENGLVIATDTDAAAHPAAASRLFTLPTAQQVHAWARGWLTARFWCDGSGICSPDSGYSPRDEVTTATAREVLAWALSCLAHAGEVWFSLSALLAALHPLVGHGYSSFGWGTSAWDPRLAEAEGWNTKDDEERQRGHWFAHGGRWYANALMVTLVSLGVVQRGRSHPAATTADCFRLTPWGRAIFGAPEIEPPAEDADAKFLVVQPNFDVVAYLDRISAAGAGTLGQLADAETNASGTVRTYRLTQGSIYRATEAGMNPAQVTDFLRRHSQNDLPANVVQSLSDWFARRESMVVRTGLTLLAFPSTAARDDYLATHKGSPCGERFAFISAHKVRGKDEATLVVDHHAAGRQTLTVDESGLVRARGRYDLIQESRLRRLAQRAEEGFRLTRTSIQRAVAQGHNPRIILGWVEDHLAEPLPLLLACALDAWTGKTPPLEMGELLLLHIPDEEMFLALATSERMRPFLQGGVGPGWLVVRREARKQLASILDELGFTVAKELTPGPIQAEEPEDEDDWPRPRRKRWSR